MHAFCEKQMAVSDQKTLIRMEAALYRTAGHTFSLRCLGPSSARASWLGKGSRVWMSPALQRLCMCDMSAEDPDIQRVVQVMIGKGTSEVECKQSSAYLSKEVPRGGVVERAHWWQEWLLLCQASLLWLPPCLARSLTIRGQAPVLQASEALSWQQQHNMPVNCEWYLDQLDCCADSAAQAANKLMDADKPGWDASSSKAMARSCSPPSAAHHPYPCTFIYTYFSNYTCLYTN